MHMCMLACLNEVWDTVCKASFLRDAFSPQGKRIAGGREDLTAAFSKGNRVDPSTVLQPCTEVSAVIQAVVPSTLSALRDPSWPIQLKAGNSVHDADLCCCTVQDSLPEALRLHGRQRRVFFLSLVSDMTVNGLRDSLA